jgi:hypothetical protein
VAGTKGPGPDGVGSTSCGRRGERSQNSALHILADEQVRKQGIRPIASVDDLAAPGIWESDEELEEFLAFTYSERRRGLA